MFILTGVVLDATFFTVMKNFGGEIVSKMFSVLRHKFCKGDYGEEQQVVED